MRPANSFSEDEIRVVLFMCAAEQFRKGSTVIRRKEFASLWRKFKQMQARVEASKLASKFAGEKEGEPS